MDAFFFVIGVNRSGTTLLSLALDSHSSIAIPYESHFFIDYFTRKGKPFDLTGQSGRRGLVSTMLEEAGFKQWDYRPGADEIDLDACGSIPGAINEIYRAYASHFGKTLWGDKTPRYIDSIDILNLMFPESTFIHIVRDGRDVALSIIRQRWGPGDLVSALRSWREQVRLARKMLNMLPAERHMELRFEDYVTDPRKELERITSFLGVGFEEQMITAHAAKAAGKVGHLIEDRHVHLREPVSCAQAFKWRSSLSPSDQAVAHELIGDELLELGYPEGRTSHPLRIPRKAYHRLREALHYRLSR
jgi:hypothetical protein